MMKVVLAFSGGLDTCFSVPYLIARGHKVITVCVNTGGFDDEQLKEIKKKAESLGAIKHYNINASKEIFDKVISYVIKLNALYQDAYPLMCSDRYIISEKCVEIAKKENAQAVAHGSTAMGNDQVRFDASLYFLAPELRVLAPIRDFQKEAKSNIRKEEIEYLNKIGFKISETHKKYSINKNAFGTTISGSEIDENREPTEDAFTLTAPLEKAPNKPDYIKINFEEGIPVSLNNKRMSGIDIIKKLNQICGSHGFGRHIYTGDCVIGIKGRIAFEAPGLYALIIAHRALEEAVLSKEQNQFKKILGEKWTQLVYSGLYYDPLRNDIEKFADSLQKFVTGKVTLKVFKGTALPVAYSSSYLAKEKGSVYAQQSSWSPEDAEGFTKLFSLPSRISKR